MSEADHLEWLKKNAIDLDALNAPSDENLVRLLSDAMRCVRPQDKADILLDVANMALALADKTLGAQSLVPQCLFVLRH